MKYSGSIKNRLIAIIMLVTLLTSVVGYSGFVYWYMKDQYKRALNLSQTVGLVLGQDIAKLVLLNDVSAAADISSGLKSFSNLDKMVLYKLDEKAIFQYSKDNKSFKVDPLPKNKTSIVKGNSLKLYIDANYKDTHLGYIELKLKIDTIFDVVKRDINNFFYILLFMCFISYLLALFFAKRFTNPILDLVRFLEKIDLVESISKRTKTKENNEYGKLYDEVNTMLDRIESSHEALKIAAVAFETQNGMTITDKDQNILQVNKAFTKITGYTQEEVIGNTPAILKSGLHSVEFYNSMYDSLQKNNFWMGEISNKHKNGNIVNEHLIIQAVLDKNKKPKYYVASFLDITEEKKIKKELSLKDEILVQQSKLAQLGEMLENIAHQWRQPLSIITTSTSGIKVQKEYGLLNDQDLVEGLDEIEDAAKHLSQTIDDFRGFFKHDKKLKTFNIEQSIDKSLKLLASRFKNKNIDIILDTNPIEVLGYENELIQVFMNILNNARDQFEKFDLEKKRYIFISTKDQNNKVYISFKDNGGGIDSNIISKIFDNHFTTKEQDSGTGIGLYMSKMIVENMDGDIEVFNRSYKFEDLDYKGAEFIVSIPYNK